MEATARIDFKALEISNKAISKLVSRLHEAVTISKMEHGDFDVFFKDHTEADISFFVEFNPRVRVWTENLLIAVNSELADEGSAIHLELRGEIRHPDVDGTPALKATIGFVTA